MSIFGNRWRGRGTTLAASSDQWEPCSREPQELHGAQADMNDLRQVIAAAYRAEFRLGASPGARIAICTYALDETDGVYRRGLRYRYSTPQRWQYVAWARDAESRYQSPALADVGASWWALNIACNPAYAASILPQVFGWDGYPFCARGGSGR